MNAQILPQAETTAKNLFATACGIDPFEAERELIQKTAFANALRVCRAVRELALWKYVPLSDQSDFTASDIVHVDGHGYGHTMSLGTDIPVCDCPDRARTVRSLQREAEKANFGAGVIRCKHSYLRDLLMGFPVYLYDPITGDWVAVFTRNGYGHATMDALHNDEKRARQILRDCWEHDQKTGGK